MRIFPRLGKSPVPLMRYVKALLLLLVLSALPACASSSSSSSKTQTQLGSEVRTLALVDAKTGQVDSYLPGPDGVTSVVSDREGGWYVGGRFTRIGNVLRRGVVHLKSDGSIDPSFVPDLPRDMAVSPILFQAGVVFVGDFGGKGVFALDAKSGQRLWHTSTGRDNTVSELASGNGVLYVGGDFTHVGGIARNGIAALNPITGKVTGWRVRLWNSMGYRGMGGADAIGVASRVVYIAGLFDSINGVKRERGVAAVSSRTGRPTAWAPRFTGATRSLGGIASILVTHGQVLAGSVDREGGFAAFDARSARALSWTQRLKGGASALASSGDTAYLGGAIENGFTRAGGSSANNLASVVLPEGRFTNWRPRLGRCTYVDALAVFGGKVFVGGYFSPEACEAG